MLQSSLNTLSDADLRTILITCDGKGKETKEIALAELIKRAKRDQWRFDEELRDELRRP